MNGVLAAESAILVHFKTIRGVLLVLDRIVVALLALVAPECDLYSHFAAPPFLFAPPRRGGCLPEVQTGIAK